MDASQIPRWTLCRSCYVGCSQCQTLHVITTNTCRQWAIYRSFLETYWWNFLWVPFRWKRNMRAFSTIPDTTNSILGSLEQSRCRATSCQQSRSTHLWSRTWKGNALAPNTRLQDCWKHARYPHRSQHLCPWERRPWQLIVIPKEVGKALWRRICHLLLIYFTEYTEYSVLWFLNFGCLFTCLFIDDVIFFTFWLELPNPFQS